MLRDAVGYTCEVKTAQETAKESRGIIGKSGGNSGKIGEFRGNSGKFRGKLVNVWGILGKLGENSAEIGGNWGKIVELCFPNGETEFTDCEINFPHIREKRGK